MTGSGSTIEGLCGKSLRMDHERIFQARGLNHHELGFTVLLLTKTVLYHTEGSLETVPVYFFEKL